MVMTVTTKLSARLDAVAKARQAYVVARATLEQRLREQMRDELTNLQTQVDIAVRYAFDVGESKASIMRAMGTKDYNTMNSSLERTQGVAEVVGADPLANVYQLVDGKLHVDYADHGADKFNGQAIFEIKKLDSGNILLLADRQLWSDDYTVRNDAVAVLDGKTDGFYYEEVVGWLSGD
jgi:hypothetical protein